MIDYGKIRNTLDKITSIVDTTKKGIEFTKDVLDTMMMEDTVEFPQVLTKEEAQNILLGLDDYEPEEAVALSTYCVFADSMAKYSNYLVDQYQTYGDDLSEDSIMIGSIEYIVEILIYFNSLIETLKKVRFGSKTCKFQLLQFAFIMDLMSGKTNLSEQYSFEFFDDVSELWEIIINIIDETNNKRDIKALSGMIEVYYDQITEVNKQVNLALEDCNSRTKKKVEKTYVKFVRRCAKEFSKQLVYQIRLLAYRRYHYDN